MLVCYGCYITLDEYYLLLSSTLPVRHWRVNTKGPSLYEVFTQSYQNLNNLANRAGQYMNNEGRSGRTEVSNLIINLVCFSSIKPTWVGASYLTKRFQCSSKYI